MAPAPTPPDDRRATRTRLLESAAELFGRQGYGGTGIKAVLADAEAPYGSLYHFFPGGKEELGIAALTHGADQYRATIEELHPAGTDVTEATKAFFDNAAETMAASDYTHSCPVATIALETSSTHEPLRRAAATAFDSWLAVLSERYTHAGMAEHTARDVAVQCFALMEGAMLLSRTSRSVEPLFSAGRAATAIVSHALATD